MNKLDQQQREAVRELIELRAADDHYRQLMCLEPRPEWSLTILEKENWAKYEALEEKLGLNDE